MLRDDPERANAFGLPVEYYVCGPTGYMNLIEAVLRESIGGAAIQQALRAGVNYNLPFSRKLVNFHVEYARNAVHGPLAIVPVARSFNEFRLELRWNVIRYVRH